MNEEILQSYLDSDPNIQNKYTFDEFASMQPQTNDIPALQIQPNFTGGISNLAQGFAQRFSPRQTFMNIMANKTLGKMGSMAMGVVPLLMSGVSQAFRPDPVKQGIAGYIDQVYGTTPTGQISSGPMAGYNAISLFGSPGAINSAIKRIGTIAKARKRKESKVLEQRQKDLQDYVSNVQRQITIQKGGIGADRLIDRGKPNMNIPDRNRGQTGGGGGGNISGSVSRGGTDDTPGSPF
tara:strand:- start:161 stop:871 length:711 start_codon:yes stop_codon:yes gene_type:complete